ncbi:MAG: DUF3179 domain-containing (seleno)protein [Halobaculum sp.]
MDSPDRRHLLGVVATGATAGCLSVPSFGSRETTQDVPTAVRLGKHGRPSNICEQEIVEDFEVRGIVDPAFADTWDGREIRPKYRQNDRDAVAPLADDAAVIGVTTDDRARAYPVPVVWWHEVVNDTFGEPLLVTFCGLCNSGMVAKRLVRGEPTRFGVSGQLWRPPDLYARAAATKNVTFGSRRWADNGTVKRDVRIEGNLVLYDEATRSFWSQILARGICGPMAGETLTQVPIRLTDWGTWRTDHQETDVLLPPPHSTLS